jgi:hypothetical protein
VLARVVIVAASLLKIPAPEVVAELPEKVLLAMVPIVLLLKIPPPLVSLLPLVTVSELTVKSLLPPTPKLRLLLFPSI